MIRVVSLMVLVTVSSACWGQSSSEKKQVGSPESATEYERAMDEGAQFYRDYNYPRAETSYLRAIELAKKSDYASDLVFPMVELGNIYREQKKYSEAEKVLLRAVDVCKIGPNCRIETIEVPLDSLRFLYAFVLEDEDKIRSLFKLITSLEDSIGVDDAKRLKCGYVDDIGEGGFPELRATLASENGCN